MNKQTMINKALDAIVHALECYVDTDYEQFIGKLAIADMLIDTLLELHDYDLLDDPSYESFARSYAKSRELKYTVIYDKVVL